MIWNRFIDWKAKRKKNKHPPKKAYEIISCLLQSFRAQEPLWWKVLGKENNGQKVHGIFPIFEFPVFKNVAKSRGAEETSQGINHILSFKKDEGIKQAVKCIFPCIAGDCLLSPGLKSCRIKIIGSMPLMSIGPGFHPFYSDLDPLVGNWPHLKLSSREPFSLHYIPIPIQCDKLSVRSRQTTDKKQWIW